MASWGRSIYENMNRKEEGESVKDFLRRKKQEKKAKSKKQWK